MHAGLVEYHEGSSWYGAALFEYGTSFDGLDRRGFGFRLEHSSRVGIDFGSNSYIEDLGGGLTDELHLTEFNAIFRVAESDSYVVHAGIGANILGDAFGSIGGFKVTAKTSVFPVEPFVLSGEIDMGTIGDAELFHVAGRIGVMLNRFEVFGGYDYCSVGGIPLKGAMFGCQVWF